MCGILAAVNYSKSVNMNRCLCSMAHRGPDDEGEIKIDNVYLGHKRLSIIDTSAAGRQPLVEDDRYYMVYNGEIYNYIELRTELLKLGCSFKSTTDSEVLLKLYARHKNKCFEVLNGMWAVVIYDKIERKLIVSRDRLGKKPLYYYVLGESIVIASEIKALLSYRSADVNYTEVARYINTGQDESEKETVFAKIFRLEPASIMEIDTMNSKLKIEYYWTLPNSVVEKYSENDAIEDYLRILEDSTRLRLRSDVNVGLMLSGGLDSSTIAAMIRDNINISAYTSYYSKMRKYDEWQYASEVAMRLNIKHKKVFINTEDILLQYDDVVRKMEMPFDGLLIAPNTLYKSISQSGTKVILEGQGADELFAGYPSNVRNYYSSKLERITVRDLHSIYAMKNNGTKDLLKIMFERIKNKDQSSVSVYQRGGIEIKGYLLKHLAYGDKLAMAYSLESRNPFLDYRLVEFSRKIPDSLKIYNGWTKYILRMAGQKIGLPKEIVWRRDKMGFPSPDTQYEQYLKRTPITDIILSSEVLKELYKCNRLKREKCYSVLRKKRLYCIYRWEKNILG